MTIRATILAVAAAGATLIAAAPAVAQGPASVAVQYRDLDLTTDAGRNALEGRIQSAARRVCSGFTGTNLAEQQGRNTCRANAINQARAQTATLAS